MKSPLEINHMIEAHLELKDLALNLLKHLKHADPSRYSCNYKSMSQLCIIVEDDNITLEDDEDYNTFPIAWLSMDIEKVVEIAGKDYREALERERQESIKRNAANRIAQEQKDLALYKQLKERFGDLEQHT